MIRVRRAIVTVVIVKTAAIRMEYTFSRIPVAPRPRARVPEPGTTAGWDAAAAIRPPARAAAEKNIPTNNNPLPRKTVAKKRSS